MANQGSIGIGRPLHVRRLTDHQVNPSGTVASTDPGTRRRRTDHQVNPSGLTLLGLPTRSLWKLIETPAYPNRYWNYPCVMGDQRGQLYWTQGSNSLFRIADATESPDSGDGWRWVRAGVQVLRCPVQAGLNTITLRARANRNPTPPPTLRLRANAALHIDEQTATAPAGPNTIHPLTLNFEASQAGVVTLQLEALDVTENTLVDWLDLTISR